MSNLTQVGSGGVVRPDVALDDDLLAIEQTASTAKDTADETAAFLETRVPEGRTINNKPLNVDITLTPDDINTYSKAAIDAKIASVVSGGYNPVKINGYLLDKDVILSPGDLGTYTSTQIDTLVNGRVPNTRKVNNKALSSDITLTAADVGAITQATLTSTVATLVPTTRTVNGQALSNNVVLTAADVGALGQAALDTAIAGRVPTTRKVNGKALSSDITLTTADIDMSGYVPRTFKINGTPMTGTEIIISGGSGSGYTKAEIDAMLQNYLEVDNGSGIATNPQVISDSSISARAIGSGFYHYQPGVDADGLPTAVSDAPPGSTSGDLIVLSHVNDTDPDNVVNTVNVIAIPDDLPALYFRKGAGAWVKIGGASAGVPLPHVHIPFNDSLKMEGEGPFDTLVIGGETVDMNTKSATFTRASTATYIDKAGIMQVAEIDEPRFEKNGLLMESAATNLYINSETYGVGAGVTISNNTGVAPNGATTMASMTETTANSEHYTNDRSIAMTAGTAYCFSTYVKNLSGTRLLYLRTASGTTAGVFFNPTTGAWVGSTTGAATDRGFEYIGNGVYRVWMTFVAAATQATIVRLQMTQNSTNSSYVGDVTCSLLVWGSQLEEGTFPTSYIKTAATAATRAADRWTAPPANGGANTLVDPYKRTVAFNLFIKGYPQPTTFAEVFHTNGLKNDIVCRLNGSSGISSYRSISGIAVPAAMGVNGLYVHTIDGDVITNAYNGQTNSMTATPLSKTDTAINIGSTFTSTARFVYYIRNIRIWHTVLSEDQIKGLA